MILCLVCLCQLPGPLRAPGIAGFLRDDTGQLVGDVRDDGVDPALEGAGIDCDREHHDERAHRDPLERLDALLVLQVSEDPLHCLLSPLLPSFTMVSLRSSLRLAAAPPRYLLPRLPPLIRRCLDSAAPRTPSRLRSRCTPVPAPPRPFALAGSGTPRLPVRPGPARSLRPRPAGRPARAPRTPPEPVHRCGRASRPRAPPRCSPPLPFQLSGKRRR